jgi:hypothetical protein
MNLKNVYKLDIKEECVPLDSNAVTLGKSLTFRQNIPLPSSGSKIKPSKNYQKADGKQSFVCHLLLASYLLGLLFIVIGVRVQHRYSMFKGKLKASDLMGKRRLLRRNADLRQG